MAIKILLADDEEDLEDLFRQQFRHQIQGNTYECFFVQNGLDALTVLKQQPDIDIFISDINMPGMDGLSVLEKVSAINPSVRTIILTAYGDMGNIRTAMNRGAFDFLTKPVEFDDLEATINKAIQSVNYQREVLELQALDAMKTRFFANITHELRTPLSLIVVLIDKLLATLHLPLLYEQPLLAIQQNARQLLRLSNQLLDIDKLEAGRMELANGVGDLPGFVEQIVTLFKSATDIKQLTLTYQTDLPPGNYVFDADKWEKILYNLLTNAVKFTETGAILVTLSYMPGTAHLTVSDTGIGIAASHLPHIFDRFYQADDAPTRTYTGTGIGLALVKELTELLGGSLTVESRTALPSGTTFRLMLPLLPVTAYPDTTEWLPPGAPPVPHPETAALSQPASVVADVPCVLVIDDNEELRVFIADALATTYRVLMAADGQEGWALCERELPDVVVADVTMPKLDGYQLTHQIKASPATSHIAVVLLTARTAHESRLEGLQQGADDYLTKPFHVDELILRLANLLTRQANLRAHLHRQLLNRTAHPDDPVVDPFVRQLQQTIENRLDDPAFDVDQLAQAASISRRTLHRKLTAVANLSPNDFIRHYRLQRAVQLLQAGQSIAETAYSVGFESPGYFATVFKQTYHQTPSEFLTTKRA